MKAWWQDLPDPTELDAPAQPVAGSLDDHECVAGRGDVCLLCALKSAVERARG